MALQRLDESMNVMDLVAEDADPFYQFALVKAGCIPRQKSGIAMFHVCFKGTMRHLANHFVPNLFFFFLIGVHLLQHCFAGNLKS
jgi:hypothetical protein